MASTFVNEARKEEILQSLEEIRARVKAATSQFPPTLVAVSKYKPASDIQICFDQGQRDFGENYVNELVEKAPQLPSEIRWHFIGTLQSNKAKILASIPNLYTVQTVTSSKAAIALDKHIPNERNTPLHILIQINTSGEEAKSGLSSSQEVAELAKIIISSCPHLRLQGLMTIGAIEQSLAGEDKNRDFEALKKSRDQLQRDLLVEYGEEGKTKWGQEGRLLTSMGMSSDFEVALKAGSDIVRVGTGIFGSRPKKEEI